jgi:hypothetical protein
MTEEKFAALVHDRLIDTEMVRQMLGLESVQGVRHRVDHGWLSGPVLVRSRGFSLWDRVQVEREEAARLRKLAKEAVARVGG